MSQLFLRSTSFGCEGISISSWKDTEETRASLENLAPLLPSSELNLGRNVDLLAIAANCANPNLVNKNDDVIDATLAVSIIDLLKHKPLNIEHQSKKIVGHILTSGFSKIGSSELMTKEEALDTSDPFNMCFGGAIYRKIYPELGRLLEDGNDPKSKFYQALSTSWEIMFNDYHIVLGSRNLKEAEVISDSKKVAELRKYLRKYGGSGKLKDGTPVYRKVVGANVLPTAFGLVSTPAAFVKGIISDSGPKKSSAAISLSTLPKKESVKNITNQTINMEIETLLEEVIAKLNAVAEKQTEEATASVNKEIAGKIKELAKEWQSNRDAALKQKDEAEAKMTELYAQVEKMSKTLAESNQKLWQMEENSRATQTLVRYNERMAAMQDEYGMDEEDCAAVAAELKTLEVKDGEKDEVFAAFKEKMGKFWKHKNKTAIAKMREEAKAAVDAEVKAKIAELATAGQIKAGEENKTVEDALDKAKASAESVINNNEEVSTQETLIDRWKKNFTKDSIKVIK